ncbi:MAG: hypothetical protein KF878_13990 [Planctomycetes bacterium]|nr:hypothetical protein [Planctomycetota bacterium]
MNRFRFSPELLGHRGEALAALAEGGYAWLSDFAAVDVLQDVYGLEVSGIADRPTARRILALLRRRFDGWPHGAVSLKARDGWRARVHRDPRPPRERWSSV